MTIWCIAVQQHFYILTGLFLILCTQLFYLIWTWENHRQRSWYLCAGWFLLLFVIFAILFDTPWFGCVPLIWIWGMTVLSVVAVVILLVRTYQKETNRITRSSIKEAMDELPVAGCYFNERGSVKLCNRQMYRLYHAMTGKDFRMVFIMHRMEGCGSITRKTE